jgi:lysophospholipase L1-like esterase
VSSRPEQPEPFLRGCVFPAVTDAPYPRADPAGAEYLPADVWDAAQLPVGVRLELAGNARTIRVWYRTNRASLGYRGESAGCSFVAYRAGQKVAMVEAVMGEGMAELVLSGRADLPVTVYLPEGMQPLVTGVAGVEETMVPAPRQPRWLAYGDAVTQGWLASAPAMAWPAVAGRKLGLDVCNLGYAGTARGESTSAVLLAETPAEVISIAFGLNNWSRVPHTTGLMSEEVRCFLSLVRQGHPEVPIVVVSPTARPDAEDSPNRVGATLAELRLAMEEAVLDWIGGGDKKVHLVEGLSVVDPEDLEDGIYPGDEGHRRLAAAVAKVLVPHLAELQEAAEIRWAKERLPDITSPVTDPAESSAAEAGQVDEVPVDGVPFETRPADLPPFDAVPVDDLPAAGTAWTDEPESLSDTLFDSTPPEVGPLEVGLLEVGPLEVDPFEVDPFEADPPNVASRNFDLPDSGSLGRESLNSALLDALSFTSSAQNGSPFDAVPVDSPFVEDSFFGDSFVEESFVDARRADVPLADGSPALDDPSVSPVVVPTLEATLAQAAAVAPAVLDPIPDIGPVTVAPFPAPEFDELSPENSVSVDNAVFEEDPVAPEDVAFPEDGVAPESAPTTPPPPPVAVPSPTTALNGDAPVSPLANGTAAASVGSEPIPEAPVHSLRRDSAPVDIAVVDMVVAALTLATNGADDVIYGHEPFQTDGLRWVEAADPGAY